MSNSEAALTMLSLFLLRLALPLVTTLLFGSVMNRLVDRWNENIER